jgi:hypothetical protein
VHGTYSGQFQNDGETIRLLGYDGKVIREFRYDDGPEWPAGADDGGRSLELQTPDSNPPHGDPSSWAASQEVGGSPGRAPGGDPGPHGYAAWKAEVFTPAQLADPAVSGDNADADGDTLQTLVEYAVGGHPLQANPERIPGAGVLIAEDRYLSLTYRRPRQIGDILYFAEAAGELDDWEAAQPMVEVKILDNGDGTETVELRDAAALDEAARRFARLRVELDRN